MRTLRSKLFFSVGAILLIVAILNYWCSAVWIRKELEKASLALNQQMESIQDTIRAFSSFILTYQIVQGAAELDGVSKMGSLQNQLQTTTSPWVFAAEVAAYNPQIAFIQIRDASKGYSVVAPESTRLYTPQMIPFEQDMLRVVVPDNPGQYLAIPITKAPSFYYLFDDDNLQAIAADKTLLLSFEASIQEKLASTALRFKKGEAANFIQLETSSLSYSWRDPPDKLFAALLANENEWIEKIDLIERLAVWQDATPEIQPAGLLKVDSALERGVCILSKDVFSTSPVIESFPVDEISEVPILTLRKQGKKSALDMVRGFSYGEGSTREVALGFSLSSIIKKIAELTCRTIIVTWKEDALGFTEQGREFHPAQEDFPLNELQSVIISWQERKYVPLRIDLKVLELTILTPESQAMATKWFLEDLAKTLSVKITLSLIGASLLSFIIALFLLNRISKKITGPIVMLSRASEELGKGKYEGLVLPQLKNRHDEIEVLTHSFEGMVVALRDRDKIRGVLNKVVSKEITEEILNNTIELGGEERTLTLLFSDIRGFTHFAEHLQPKVVIGLLNDYMTRMCRIIDETHGVVDKFVGDEIMALYGAPLALVDNPMKAIEAAILMMQELSNWNEERRQRQEPVFEIGIGIHTGLACTGNMGAENRLNYTAIGANVNLASRLCGAAGAMQILISEETYKIRGVQEKFRCKPLSPIILKGIDHPVSVYEVLH